MKNRLKNKIVHIIIMDKFIPPFIDFIDENFDIQQHSFIILGKEKYKFGLTKEHDVMWVYTPIKLLTLGLNLHKAKKIIMHGLWSKIFNIVLLMQPQILKKTYWIIWGGDLYSLRDENDFIKKQVIKKIGNIICYHYSEYNIAVKLGNTQGKYFQSFFYPSNLYKDIELHAEEHKKDIYIQIGNSADPSNNHLEVFTYLEKYKDKNIKIIVPLSYGDKEYANEVILKGKNIFGEKIVPITEYMSFDDYMKVLSSIDIAIFNHNRQQAMGNITTLIGLGKKVYLSKDIITWKYLTDIGIKIFDIKDFNLLPLDIKAQEKNMRLTKDYFSKKNLISQWHIILESN